MKILKLSFATLFCVLSLCKADTSSCGDWESFRESNCYKLLDKDNLHAHSDGEKLCQQNGGSLISIHTAEEEDFLVDYLFTKIKVVDNVWLAAQFVPAESKYKWTRDGTELSYTNWAEGSLNNLADYCLEMRSEIKSLGKWMDTPCSKKNLVVCQRAQIWSTDKMQKLIEQLLHREQKAQLQFSQGAQREIANLQQIVLKTEARLQEAETKLTEVVQEIAATKAQLQGIGNSQGNGNSVPIGFIYTQLPGEKAPAEIWSSLAWTDVSSTYAGVFFRVAGGGNATQFGAGVQADSAPRLTRVDFEAEGPYSDLNLNPLERTDYCVTRPEQRIPIRSGYYAPSLSTHYSAFLYFTVSGGEVRPRNLSVKIWKRTG